MNLLRSRYFAPTVAWALGLTFALLTLCFPEPGYRLEPVHLTNSRHMPLWTILYIPVPLPASPAPAAIICEPFNSPPEYSRLLALELLKSGFIVLTFDWRGRSPQENRQLLRSAVMEAARADAAAAAAYLRALPQVDPDRIAIAGHSVGGTLAIEVADSDPRIMAVASIGMEADVAQDRPRNLLWVVGLYDEFRVLNRMRDVFQASAGTTALEEVTVRDIRRGTARRLAVSPTADHFTELQDAGIHREVVKWFREAAGLPGPSPPMGMETRTRLIVLAWLATLVGAFLTLGNAAGRNRWTWRGVAGGALLGAGLLTQIRGNDYLLAVEGAEWLLVLTLASDFLSRHEPAQFWRGGRLALRFGWVFWVSLLLTFMVNNVAYYWQHPNYLLVFPEFAIRHALDGLYAYLVIYPAPFLFSTYNPQAITLRAWVYVLLGIELLRPGIFSSVLARLPRPPARPAPRDRRRNWISVAILLLLLCMLGGVGWMRFQQGFLTSESAWSAGRYLARFCVLPLLIFSLLWRLSRRQPVLLSLRHFEESESS